MTHPTVRLDALDEDLIERIVDLAVADAEPDEVMPPVQGAGRRWSDDRAAALRDYHQARVDGLAGPNAEVGFAVMAEGQPAGVARLREIETGTLEAGLWLGRSARRRGIGSAILEPLLAQAGYAGAHTVVADTTTDNEGAMTVLRRWGVALGEPAADGSVRARISVTADAAG